LIRNTAVAENCTLPTTQLNGAAKMYGRREESYNCLLL
jgi:hypothetical protein